MIAAMHARLQKGPANGKEFQVSDPPPQRGYYVSPGTFVAQVPGGGTFVADADRYRLTGPPAAGGVAIYEHAGKVDP
jgi:hypothetical protein